MEQPTVEELGAKFGIILTQYLAQIVLLERQNATLAKHLNELLSDHNELKEENERLVRITGPVGHK